MKAKHTRKIIKLTNLFISPDNPRFESVSSQVEAIKTMLHDEKKQKIYNLAKDIAEVGLNPADPIIVIPDSSEKDRFIVKEGNRRITALKLLSQPNLIPNSMKSLIDKFKDLNKNIVNFELNEIECLVFQNEDEINRWIQLKHTGQNDGIGTVGWDTIQQKRFLKILGKKSMPLQVLEYARNKMNLDNRIKSKLDTIALTNLERIINDPDFAEFLGISMDGENNLQIDENVIKRLEVVLSDLVLQKIKVKNIYYKKDRINYMDELTKRLSSNSGTLVNTDSTATQTLPTNNNSNNSTTNVSASGNNSNTNNPSNMNNTGTTNNIPQNTKSTSSKKNKGKHKTTARKFLITCVLQISHPRIRNIYRELREIEVEQYTNAVAVLFRVFIELSLDYYCGKNAIPSISPSSQLHQKVDAVANYMLANSIMNDKELKPIRSLASRPNDYASINTFNAYIHNMDFNPLADNLKLTWDNIEKFVIKIWE